MSLVEDVERPTESMPLLAQGGDEFKVPQKIFVEELYILPRYALPVLGSQILEYSMSIVNIVSIGHLSTTALAAISLGSMASAVTGFSVLNGLASGLETVLPTAFTSSEPQLVGLWTQRMAVVMACALVPVCLIWQNAEPIFLTMKQDPEVARLATLYLRWMSLGLPAVALNIIGRRYFQSQRLFSVQTRIIFFVAPINALANYALVWGPERVRLGFIGAPIATVVSHYLIAIASFFYVAFFLPRTVWHPLSTKIFNDLDIVVRLGLSGVAQVTSQCWAWEFATLLSSYMGPTTLAAHSILVTTSAMAFQLHFSNVDATTVRIGNLLGERNDIRAGIASRAGLAIALMSATFTCSSLLMARTSWPRLFNDDPAVVLLVSRVLPIIAMFQFIDATNAMGAGFLRVRGKQFIGGLMNVSAYFIIGLPLGLWFVYRCDLGLHGIWFGMTLALAFNCTIGLILWSKTDWKKEVLKVAHRNSREARQRALKIREEENCK